MLCLAACVDIYSLIKLQSLNCCVACAFVVTLYVKCLVNVSLPPGRTPALSVCIIPACLELDIVYHSAWQGQLTRVTFR